jgi:hypothetical protein
MDLEFNEKINMSKETLGHWNKYNTPDLLI